MQYSDVTIEYETRCVDCTSAEWERLMQGAKRACKRKVNALVKKFYPDMYRELALNLYNPYEYFRTKTHLILVHSAIEYFFRIGY
jgi:hypothetical protein